jgi:Flp pilus assembly protein TadB
MSKRAAPATHVAPAVKPVAHPASAHSPVSSPASPAASAASSATPSSSPTSSAHPASKSRFNPFHRGAKQKAPEEPGSKPLIEKKKRKTLTRRSLQEYLDKAGYDVNAEKMKRRVHNIVLSILGVYSVITLIYMLVQGASIGWSVVFFITVWTVLLAAGLLGAYACVYFFLDYRIYTRTRELEDVLPDYLQLASANISAGMPIDRALWYAIRPNFGVLAKEMEDVAKATMAGEDLEQSLMRFTERYESTTLKRSISILIEGLHAGGEMADLLTKISLNIQEMKIMKKEMAASVTTYAIFITFASVIIAPFLFGLATELLTIIVKIAGSLDTGGGGSSMLSLTAPPPEAIGNFKTFSVLMLLVSTIFSACIVSVIKHGNVRDGIKTIPVYAGVAIGLYILSVALLHSVLGGII